MSFLSCIGKKSKRSKASKNGRVPLDKRLSESVDTLKQGRDDVPYTKNGTPSHKSTASADPTNKSNGPDVVQKDSPTNAEIDKLQAEIEKLEIENRMYKSECEKSDTSTKSYLDDIRRLETTNLDIRSKLTIAETEAARLTIENQKLLQRIVGMEENQAMMSRAELQSMISQLEEAEMKTSSKPATELSGIRTNPGEGLVRKKLTQEDKQMSWRLSKAESRLSQSEDENKRLRDDLKDMLDSHSELQMQIVSDTHEDISNKKVDLYTSICYSNTSITHSEEETQTNVQDYETSDTDDLLDRLLKAEADQSLMKIDYSILEETLNDVEKRLALEEERNNELQNNFIASNSAETLIKCLCDQELKQTELKTELMDLESVCGGLNSRIDKLYSENNHYKTKSEVLIQESNNQKNKIDQMQHEVKTLKVEIKKLSDENRRLSQQLQKRRDTGKNHVDVEAMQRELSELKHSHEEANRRLKEMSAQTNKVPTHIKSLDLISPSPSTIAERFRRELYEQRWTEACNVMTEKLKRDEKKTIQILAEMCTESYLFCKRAARFQMDTMTSSLVSPTSNHYRSGQFNKRNGVTKNLAEQLPEDLRRRLVLFRSRPSQEMLNSGLNDFLNQIDYDRTRFLRNVSERDLTEILPYITTCFELSWCMAVQEPPMYLLFKVKHGVDIDNDRFDKYQSRGKRVDFVVWPSVFTEENGQCLQKGVVQALPERS